MVRRPNNDKASAETDYVYTRPDLMDSYLGNPTGLTGFAFTDRGWVYEMIFDQLPGEPLNIPAQSAEQYSIFYELWGKYDGGQPLSSRPSPAEVQSLLFSQCNCTLLMIQNMDCHSLII